MAGSQECLNAIIRISENGMHGGRNQHIRGEDTEIADLVLFRVQDLAAMEGAVVSNPMAKNTTCLSGVFRANLTASKGE
jgi:hypothetical protein